MVHSGEYEQRAALYACPTEGLAAAVAARLGDPLDDIVEITVFESTDEAYRYPVYEIGLDEEGTEVERRSWDASSWHSVSEESRRHRWRNPFLGGRKLPTFVGISTASFERAEELARAAMILP